MARKYIYLNKEQVLENVNGDSGTKYSNHLKIILGIRKWRVFKNNTLYNGMSCCQMNKYSLYKYNIICLKIALQQNIYFFMSENCTSFNSSSHVSRPRNISICQGCKTVQTHVEMECHTP